jgi:hypothetical protein
MRSAQRDIAYKQYLQPAIEVCREMSFVLPLSLAVVYDSITHGSWQKIRERVAQSSSPYERGLDAASADTVVRSFERDWIAEYVKKRDAWLARIPRLAATRYRTRFFLDQIRLSNWELDLPLLVNGVKLTGDLFTGAASGVADKSVRVPTDSAAGPDALNSSPLPDQGDTNAPQGSAISSDSRSADGTALTNAPAQPPKITSTSGAVAPTQEKELIDLDSIEARVNAAAAKYDQVERIATTVTTRNDAAKSFWTTVIGSLSQTFWALFGLLAGIPREVWLVVAVIAAALMLLYLYRQIELGKIRENRVSGPGFQVSGQ